MAQYRVPNILGFEWQKAVLDKDLATPPASPNEGDRYLIASGATDAWAGHDGDITWYENGAWYFIPKKEGMFVYVKDEDQLYYYNGSAWNVFSSGTGGADSDWTIGDGVIYNTTDKVGIGTDTPTALLDILAGSTAGQKLIAFTEFAGRDMFVVLSDFSGNNEDNRLFLKAYPAGFEATALSIRGDGILSFPDQSAVRVKASNSQTISNYNWTIIQFDTIIYDRRNEYDTTNYRFTASEDGLYLVNYCLSIDPIADSRFSIGVFKNGSAIRFPSYHASNVRVLSMVCSTIIEMTAGDYIDFRVWHDAGSDITTNVTYAERSFVEIYKVA